MKVLLQLKEDSMIKELWEEYNQPLNLSKTHMRYTQTFEKLQKANWDINDELLANSFRLPEIRDPFLDTRIIEFIFSLPSLPWLYDKHIMRSSMKNFLPKEVVKRPKTLLGNLSYAYLKQSENKWINSWVPNPELSTYINIRKLPYSADEANKQISSINLRPLYFNTWINNISQLNN